MSATQDFMKQMLREVPALEETYREHEATYGEVLPHVLMADVTRLALGMAGRIQAHSDSEPSILTILLDVLDRGIQSASSPVQELIAVSFLENLEEGEPNYRALTRLLPPALAHEMTRLHGGDEW